MRAMQFPVATKHYVGLGNKPPYVIFAHGSADDVFHLISGINFSLRSFHDPHVSFDWRDLPFRCDLLKRFARHRRFRFVVCQPDRSGTAVVRKRLQ